MGLGHMGGTEPVQGAQDPQVGEVVLPPGKAEQAEPVTDRERVEVERISLVVGDRHHDEPLPVHMAIGALRFPMMAPWPGSPGAAAAICLSIHVPEPRAVAV